RGRGRRRTRLLRERERSEFSFSAAGAARRYVHRGNRRFGACEGRHQTRGGSPCGARPCCRSAHRRKKTAKGVTMLIARVVGELVATQKHASHEGRKLL